MSVVLSLLPAISGQPEIARLQFGPYRDFKVPVLQSKLKQ